MRTPLLEKIGRSLGEPLEREMQVVYLLVEIRKFLEQNSLGRRFPSLNFHCCWAMHSKATGLGADRILRRFDEAHPYYPNVNAAPTEVVERIGKTMGLNSLRAELRRFLTVEMLPTNIVDDFFEWMNFLNFYFAVIEDCPFVLAPNSQVMLHHLSEIVVTRLTFEPRSPEIVFATYWRLIGTDGKEVGKYMNVFTGGDIPEWIKQHAVSIPQSITSQ